MTYFPQQYYFLCYDCHFILSITFINNFLNSQNQLVFLKSETNDLSSYEANH